MDKIVEIVDKVFSIIDSPVIAIVAAIIVWFFGFFHRGIIQYIKQKKLRRLLDLKSNNGKQDCEIIIPIRHGTLSWTEEVSTNGSVEKHEYTLNKEYSYVTYEESLVLLEIPRLLNQAGQKGEVSVVSANETMHAKYNKFCYGGYAANPYVYNIFLDLFADRFWFGCTEQSYYHKGNEHLQRFKRPSTNVEDQKSLYYLDSNGEVKQYKYTDDYIILIKLSDTDFSESSFGTVHIGFGYGSEAVLNSLRCLSDRTDELYKRLKNHKHYFVIMKYSSKNGVDLSSRSFCDITDEMLN